MVYCQSLNTPYISMTHEKLDILLFDTLPSLQLYAQHYMHTREDAEDLLQDTLLRILERQQQCYECNFNGWAYKILIHLYLDRLRKKRHAQIFNDIPIIHLENSIYCETTIDLDDLQQPFRETMELLVAGYDYEEIAQMQHISMGTVKSRIHRARKKLRHLWE